MNWIIQYFVSGLPNSLFLQIDITNTTWLHSVTVPMETHNFCVTVSIETVTQKLWVKWLKTAYCDPPVTVLTTCLTRLGGFISSRRMLGSVARGNPLSSISSSNYKNKPMIKNLPLQYKVFTINNEGVNSTGYFSVICLTSPEVTLQYFHLSVC